MLASIADLTLMPIDIEMAEPFGIASGAQEVAENAFVRVMLDDGTVGLGEAAPFPAVNGETRERALDALARCAASLRGAPARWRRVAAMVREIASDSPSARCAVETAVLDALTRRGGMSLWAFFGAADEALTTDITIVTGTPDDAGDAAARAVHQGFETLKMKVGGTTLDEDVARIARAHEAAPRAALILDANGAFDAPDAVALVGALAARGISIALFEQPTPPDDLDGLRRVGERVTVAADESARTPADVIAIAKASAARVINVKITKSGIADAVDMIAIARAANLRLMVGGMVESPLAMTTSACIAAGIGGFDYVDLDTPMFMKSVPTRGGWTQNGPRIEVASISAGHGVDLA